MSHADLVLQYSLSEHVVTPEEELEKIIEFWEKGKAGAASTSNFSMHPHSPGRAMQRAVWYSTPAPLRILDGEVLSPDKDWRCRRLRHANLFSC